MWSGPHLAPHPDDSRLGSVRSFFCNCRCLATSNNLPFLFRAKSNMFLIITYKSVFFFLLESTSVWNYNLIPDDHNN